MRTRLRACIRALARPLTLGLTLWSLGCGGSAEQAVRKDKAIPPADPVAAQKYLRASALLKSGRPADEDRALTLLRSAVKIDAYLWEAHYNLGVVYRGRGELRQALTHFHAAHEIQPAAPEPLTALAEVEHRLENRQEAAELLERYLESRPDEIDVRVARTAVLREEGNFDAALEEARAALVRAPDHIGALLEVGRIYREKNELDVADLVFKKALALDDKSARPHNELGLTALSRGDTQLAFEHFRRALEADPKFAPARLNRASVLLRAGDYAAAEREYELVLRDDASKHDARVGLGIALRGQGKYERARAQYEEVLDEAPHHAAALFDLAILQAEFLNQRPQARERFAKFVEIAPEGPQRELAQRYLQEIPAPAPLVPSTPARERGGKRARKGAP